MTGIPGKNKNFPEIFCGENLTGTRDLGIRELNPHHWYALYSTRYLGSCLRDCLIRCRCTSRKAANLVCHPGRKTLPKKINIVLHAHVNYKM